MTAQDPRIGRLLDGRYRIVALIGAGGIGAVYRAEHAALDRSVAVKVLLEGFADIPELRARFAREAKALSALSHPHVVPVIDFGLEPEPYLVMELLVGRTLEELLREGPLPPPRALHLARQILSGLAFAHARGVAHRDLKPANVFLQTLPEAHDHVRLLDFGLAKFLDDEHGETDATLTKVGMVFGTPAYMAPEQATGGRADARADVYSAGVLLYELLTGKRPFNDPTRAELLRAHMLHRPPPVADARPGLVLSADLQSLLDRALEKEPPARFPDAGAMLAALEALPADCATIDARAEAAHRERAAAHASAHSEDATRDLLPVGPPPTDPMDAKSRSVDRPTDRVVRASSPRRSWVGRGALALVVLTGLCGVGYVIVGVLGTIRSPDHAPDVAATNRPTTNPPPPPPATAPASPSARPAARDPWREAPPRPLRIARAKMAQHSFRESDLRPLKDYARDAHDDARGHLALAQGMMELGWRSDALTRYRIAFATDPSVRGDPRALDDVAGLAQLPSLHGQAMRLLRQVWGDEAPALLELAAARAVNPAQEEALRALRAELRTPSR